MRSCIWLIRSSLERISMHRNGGPPSKDHHATLSIVPSQPWFRRGRCRHRGCGSGSRLDLDTLFDDNGHAQLAFGASQSDSRRTLSVNGCSIDRIHPSCARVCTRPIASRNEVRPIARRQVLLPPPLTPRSASRCLFPEEPWLHRTTIFTSLSGTTITFDHLLAGDEGLRLGIGQRASFELGLGRAEGHAICGRAPCR